MTKLTTSLSVFVALFLCACGGSAPAEESTPTEAEATEGGAEGASEAAAVEWPPFDEMDHETKGRYMAAVVVPRMNEVFAAGPETDRVPREVNCATCHGDNAQEVDFHMPNSLYPLVPQEIAGMFTSDDAELAAIAGYMAGPVEHTMAELLGREPYNQETGEGFGCLGCHAVGE